jgi:hypothetical protein
MYYKWTQEVFLLLHKQGLVEQVCVSFIVPACLMPARQST